MEEGSRSAEAGEVETKTPSPEIQAAEKESMMQLNADVSAEVSMRASPNTDLGKVFLRVQAALNDLQKELALARADPAHFAVKPGIIMHDKGRPGKFVFMPNEEVSKYVDKCGDGSPGGGEKQGSDPKEFKALADSQPRSEKL
jgi:hypothetical protein